MQPLAHTFSESRHLRQFSRWLPYGLIALFAVITSIARLEFFPDRDLLWHVIFFGVALGAGYIFWYGFDLYIQLLDRWLPYDGGIGRRILLQISISLVLLVGMRLLSQALIGPYVSEHIANNLINPFQPTRLINLFLFMADTLFVLAMNLGYISNHFFRVWKENLIKAERLQKEAAVVRFDNLRNQLNPHFLFNSLTSLNSLIHEDQALASQFLQQLSRVYRYVLQHKDEQLVPLRVELEFIRNYISLLQTRFQGALRIEVHVPQDKAQWQLVPVTLQILVENALKHNRLSEREPLLIVIETNPAGTVLVVRNTLQRKAIVETSNRTGLDNMRALYAYYTPSPVVITESATEFQVHIPLIAPAN